LELSAKNSAILQKVSSACSIASFKPNSLADFIQARGCFCASDEITGNKEKLELFGPHLCMI